MSIKKLIFSVVCTTLSTSALANTTDIKAANNQAGIQYTSTQVNYTETGNGLYGANGATLDTENGTVPGVALSISSMQDWWLGNDYLQLAYSRDSGHTHYIGGAADGTTPYGSISGQDGAVIKDYDLRYGKGFILPNNIMLTPYLEIGHHEWDRAVNAGETYTNKYYGAGMLGQYSPVRLLVLTANAFIGRTYHASINLTPDPYGFTTGMSADLGSSNLYKVGLAADYALTPTIHANLGIDYNQFKYGYGALGNTGYGEPDSKTTYTTMKVGLGYAF